MPSSVILAMQYDPAAHELTIVFRGSREIYCYAGVAPEEWLAFRNSASKGTYLNEVFKPRHDVYRRLTTQSHSKTSRAERSSASTTGTAANDSSHLKKDELRWGETWALPR